MVGFGNRHSPSADTRRSDTSASVANLKSTPAELVHTVPVRDSGSNPSGGPLHFFSLPHWTRRILPVSPPVRKSLAGVPHTDEHGVIPRSTSPRRFLYEKDLPPIPSPHADVNTTSHEPSAHPNDTRVSISIQHATETPPQPTFYLDVYHNTPIVPPPTNSVAFTSFPGTSTENVLRKSKSTRSLRPDEASSSLGQRARGVSLTQLFTTAKRAQTLPSTTSENSPSTPLVRKSSFWSRKLPRSSPQHPTVPAGSPSLPTLKSTSPLGADFTAPAGSLARSRSNSSGVERSRRYSERAVRSMTHKNIPSLPQSPVSDRANVRPSTADPYILASRRPSMRRPTTADSVTPSRALSLFALSQQSKIPSDEPFSAKLTPPPQSKINRRPRSSTNPPLLHRLSVNLFASSPSSVTKNGSFFSNDVTSSPDYRSPRSSLSQIPPDVLKPQADETSETFLDRLVSLVSKADTAGVLASNGDPIYADSLRLFMERFGFHGDPLDVALRRLLMNVGLPRETQQIDRVIEAFANRYLSCNPDIFTSRDHPYILAFSLIMLHTDAFNKSNRRKMSKADYLRNTALPGLIPEVLDCFYDNIVFAPFIFIEDPSEPEGNVEGNLTRPSTSSGLPSPMTQSSNTLLSRPKVDPYYLITNNSLDQLRVNVEGQISHENPFRWDGTGITWDYDEILLAFAKGHRVQIGSVDMRSTGPFFSLSVGGIPSPSVNGSIGGVSEMFPAPETWTIKLAKVAVLNRKDDLLEGGKKPLGRKWRPYSVALTKSQLLLFRDLSWSPTLLSWNDPPKKPPIPSTSFKPDETISLNDALAVLDRSYSKHPNTFRLTTRDGRHILFQTTEEKETNDWISRINYASAFKTAGIRMRSLGMTNKSLELTGVAAATSHIHDLQLPNASQPRVLTWDHRNLSGPADETPGYGRLHEGYSAGVDGRQRELADLSAPEIEGASQFKETFDTVKAELASARTSAGDISVVEKPCPAESPHLASRSHMIRTRVEDLENRICVANEQIGSNMHVARNIAILAPFRKSTRDRLQDNIQTMSKKIQAMRLGVTKLICHRNILLNDLAVEEKNFKEATSLALQAATETLQQRYSEYTSQSSFDTQELQPKSSFNEETPPIGSQFFDSPTNGSLRSALDFGPDWPSSGEAFAAPSLWGPSLIADSLVTSGHDISTSCCPTPDEGSYFSLSTTNQSPPDTSLRGNVPVAPELTEEQAEEWNKTRAAKRVSLVKLPPNLRMSVITGRSCHRQDSTLLDEEIPGEGEGHRT